MTSQTYRSIDHHIDQLGRLLELASNEIQALSSRVEDAAIADQAHPQAELFTPAEITLRIPAGLRLAIDAVARANAQDPAQVIQRALEQYLARRDGHTPSEPTA